MKLNKATSTFILYLCSTALILGIKYWYRSAGSNELNWILSPTARWVEILSGISFEKVPNLGYINHSIRFIIAPSCSGVQFMLIAFAALCFPFLCRIGTMRQGIFWMVFSLPTAYLYAIACNGIRILLSIYIPAFLEQNLLHTSSGTWMTPEKLHTMIGTAVYFTSLLILYHGAETLYQQTVLLVHNKHPQDALFCGIPSAKAPLSHIFPNKKFPAKISKKPDRPFLHTFFRYMPPAICYFSITLGIPFLGRIYRNNWDNFTDYALLTASICLAILLLTARAGSLYKQHKGQSTDRH